MIGSDRILYQNGYIGDVGRVARSGAGHYLVEMDIAADHKEKLTVHSLFYIATDPNRPTRKAVFTEQEKPGGLPLADHSTVVVLDHPPLRRNMPDDRRRQTLSGRNGIPRLRGPSTLTSQEIAHALCFLQNTGSGGKNRLSGRMLPLRRRPAHLPQLPIL